MLGFKPQVPKEHYFKGYDEKARWISYWCQINEVLKTNTKIVLEVGIGNGTVSSYLKRRGLNVTTVDLDPSLSPDFVCSVTDLSKTFEPDSFECILCAQVLEHIPFEYFEIALENLSVITSRYVVLSLPYSRFGFSIKVDLFPFPRGISLKCTNAIFRIPLFFLKHKPEGEHYWEIGKRSYSLGIIRRILNKKFEIMGEFSLAENPSDRFFTLKKKG